MYQPSLGSVILTRSVAADRLYEVVLLCMCASLQLIKLTRSVKGDFLYKVVLRSAPDLYRYILTRSVKGNSLYKVVLLCGFNLSQRSVENAAQRLQ